MTKLTFYVDFDRDLRIYKKWKIRKFFGENYFNSLLKMSYPKLVGKTDKEIINYFKNNKEKIIHQTEKSGEKLKQEWANINNNFFQEVEKVTDFKWKHKVYKCHLSSTFICGGCYDAQRGNIVSIFPRLEHALDTLFHELIHLHFWDTIDELRIEHNKKERLTAQGKVWDLSEIAVNYPLQKIKIEGYKSEFNTYPQHRKLWNKIKKYWNLDFKNFILKSLEEKFEYVKICLLLQILSMLKNQISRILGCMVLDKSFCKTCSR